MGPIIVKIQRLRMSDRLDHTAIIECWRLQTGYLERKERVDDGRANSFLEGKERKTQVEWKKHIPSK